MQRCGAGSERGLGPPGLQLRAPPAAPGSPRSRPEDPAKLLLSELVGLQSPQPTRGPQQLEAAAEMGRFDFLSPPRALLTPLTPRPAATPQRAGTPRRSPTPGPTPPRTPQQTRTPGRMMGSLTPMKSPAVPASPFVICEGGGCAFGFMLRLADGVELGLDVTHGIGGERALCVTEVKPGGAIEAWNRQCVGGPSAGKAVMPGDRIVAVNGASDPEAMLAECRERQMLRLTVVRGEPDCDIPGLWSSHHGSRGSGGHAGIFKSPFSAKALGSSSSTLQVQSTWDRSIPRSPALRAGACEFVPGAAASAPPGLP